MEMLEVEMLQTRKKTQNLLKHTLNVAASMNIAEFRNQSNNKNINLFNVFRSRIECLILLYSKLQ